MWSLGVGSRDYPYFTNFPKNAGSRFNLPTYAFTGGGMSQPHNPLGDGPVYYSDHKDNWPSKEQEYSASYLPSNCDVSCEEDLVRIFTWSYNFSLQRIIYIYNFIVSVGEQKRVCRPVTQNWASYGKSKHRFGISAFQLTGVIHFHVSVREKNSEFYFPS